MKSANALYLPVSKGIYEKASLPGKLFEYLGSNRPIIASSKPDSEVTAVLSSVGGNCVVAPGDIETLAEVIEKLCATEGSTPFSERIPGAVSRYERSNLTKDLASLLERISKTR
jgi:glycosyltransferase involved in cell wall biosynthesis